MAIAIRNIGSSVMASSVSAADKGGTGSNADDLSVFQIFNLLSEPPSAENSELIERIYNAPPDAELLRLNPQALDLLNGVSSAATEAESQLSLSLYLPAQRNPDAAPGVTFTPLEMESISSIISQYADSPFNVGTVLQIQKDLAALRIDTSKLSLKAVMQIVLTGNTLANS